MSEPSLNDLYQRLGEVIAGGNERKEQTAELFAQGRIITSQLGTISQDQRSARERLERHFDDDRQTHDEMWGQITKLHETIHGPDGEAARGLVARASSLEEGRANARKLMRAAVATAVGMPPFLVSAIELIKVWWHG